MVEEKNNKFNKILVFCTFLLTVGQIILDYKSSIDSGEYQSEDIGLMHQKLKTEKLNCSVDFDEEYTSVEYIIENEDMQTINGVFPKYKFNISTGQIKSIVYIPLGIMDNVVHVNNYIKFDSIESDSSNSVVIPLQNIKVVRDTEGYLWGWSYFLIYGYDGNVELVADIFRIAFSQGPSYYDHVVDRIVIDKTDFDLNKDKGIEYSTNIYERAIYRYKLLLEEIK
ncbi:hypothetical protein NHG33_08240 [Aerococcaceae bacterium NML130460]|nr:hypothetical protein [Aerococcaceae bacterium NML171108]MCW6681180.1 hypothetical protein [Aerococcaceae bacterium NML130460]